MSEEFPNVTVVDHPLINVRLTELRDRETETPKFRRSLHELAQLMTFEVTRGLEVSPTQIETPMTSAAGVEASRPIVLVPILRAGLGMMHGVSQVLPEAAIGHIGMFRNEETLQPESYYCNLPDAAGEADVLLIDPMLATGHSSCAAITQLKAAGAKRIIFICLVSCPEGLRHFGNEHPDVPVFTASVDDGLNEVGYIMPGLGDAGDRYFGTV